jgi:hypothetical protein
MRGSKSSVLSGWADLGDLGDDGGPLRVGDDAAADEDAAKVECVGELLAVEGVVDADESVEQVLLLLWMLASRRWRHFFSGRFSACRPKSC